MLDNIVLHYEVLPPACSNCGDTLDGPAHYRDDFEDERFCDGDCAGRFAAMVFSTIEKYDLFVEGLLQ